MQHLPLPPCHFRFANTMWVRLHPRIRSVISAFSILQILVSKQMMCLTVDHLLLYSMIINRMNSNIRHTSVHTSLCISIILAVTNLHCQVHMLISTSMNGYICCTHLAHSHVRSVLSSLLGLLTYQRTFTSCGDISICC